MSLKYTDHLKIRLKQREISIKIVPEIFKKNEERYWDSLRGHYIVVSTVEHKGKDRKVLASYDKIRNILEVITVHPIDDGEIKRRLLSGRWIYEKEEQN